MPRGVYCNSRAALVVHLDSSEWANEEEFLEPELWRETIDYIMEMIEARWPSFASCDRWDGNEEHVLLENRHAEVMVYEYCGMTSIALVPRTDCYQEHPELAEHWCNQIAAGLQTMMDKAFPGKTLNRTSGYTTSVREVVTS